MRSLRLLAAIALIALLATAARADVGEFPVYTGDEFQALYGYAVENTLTNLEPAAGQLPITGDEDLDQRIWETAMARGYVLRPLAGDDLARADGVPMQPQPAAAWEDLKTAAREAGLAFIVSSAYRSPESQRAQFNSKLRGTSDEAIDAALTWYSIPGTSKHHSGYALDFRYRDGVFADFRTTPDYAWLSADNFYNAKRFGFIPSYPDDVTAQGPNPEPWEFVWVGVDLIRCGLPVEVDTRNAGPAGAIAAEVGSCPGEPGDDDFLPLWLARWLAV